MRLDAAVFGNSCTAVLCGPRELTATVTFRLANEAAADGRRVLCLRRGARGSEAAPPLPARLSVAALDGAALQDGFCFQPKLLRLIDEIYVNNMHELKMTLGLVQTLQHPPGLIVVEGLSELVDPLYSTGHAEFAFLNQVLAARHLIDDTARSLRRGPSCGEPQQRPRVVITDSCSPDSPLAQIAAQGGAPIAVLAAGTARTLSIEVRRPTQAFRDGSGQSAVRVASAVMLCGTAEYFT